MRNSRFILACSFTVHLSLALGCAEPTKLSSKPIKGVQEGSATSFSLSLKASREKIVPGETVSLYLIANRSGSEQIKIDQDVSWVSSAPTVLKIKDAKAGLFEALKPGEAEIEAKFGSSSAKTLIKVSEGLSVSDGEEVLSLRIVPAVLTLSVKGQQSFEVFAVKRDGTEDKVDPLKLIWESSEKGVATFSSEIGKTATLTTHEVGKSVISARMNNEKSVTIGTADLTVRPLKVKRIDIRPSSANIQVNGTQNFMAFAILEDDSQKVVTQDLQWYVDNTNLASLQTAENGVAILRGLKAGTAKVFALIDGVRSTESLLKVEDAPPAFYTLSISSVNSGSGTVTGTGGLDCSNCLKSYPAGSQVTISANPSAQSLFSTWGGDCSGTQSTCTLIMNRSVNISASFIPRTYVNLDVTNLAASLGSISSNRLGIPCSQSCQQQVEMSPTQTITFTATPIVGAIFSGWSGACQGTNPNCTVTLTSNRELYASFAPISMPSPSPSPSSGYITITFNNLTPSLGSVASNRIGVPCAQSCQQTIPANSSQMITFTANPYANAVFAGWTGACQGTGPTCTVSLGASLTINAVFASVY